MTAMIVMPSGLAVLQCWLYLAGIVVQYEALAQQAGRKNLSFSQGQRHRFMAEADQSHQQLSKTPLIKLYAAYSAECDRMHRTETKAARLQSQTQTPWPRMPLIKLYAANSAEYDRMHRTETTVARLQTQTPWLRVAHIMLYAANSAKCNDMPCPAEVPS